MEKKITISFTQKQIHTFTAKDGTEYVSVLLPYSSKYKGYTFILPVAAVSKCEEKDYLFFAELDAEKNIKISRSRQIDGKWENESVWLKASRLKKELDSWKKAE